MNDKNMATFAPGPVFDDVAPSSQIIQVHDPIVAQTTRLDPDALAEIRKLSEKLDEAVSGIRDINHVLERIVRMISNI